MAYVSETSKQFEEDSCYQVNQIPRMHSQQSAFQGENANLMGEMKFVHKRLAQTWENDFAKVPKLTASHLCPQMYHSPVDQCVVTKSSNTTHPDHNNSMRQCDLLYTQTTSVNATVGVAQEHLQSGLHREKQMNKLCAQKIAIGI